MKIDAFSFSTFSALSELVVTGLVLFVIIGNVKGRPLRWKLLFGTLAFELLVNVAYMLRRLLYWPAAPRQRRSGLRWWALCTAFCRCSCSSA